jgi:hypothetical protein
VSLLELHLRGQVKTGGLLELLVLFVSLLGFFLVGRMF